MTRYDKNMRVIQDLVAKETEKPNMHGTENMKKNCETQQKNQARCEQKQ